MDDNGLEEDGPEEDGLDEEDADEDDGDEDALGEDVLDDDAPDNDEDEQMVYENVSVTILTFLIYIHTPTCLARTFTRARRVSLRWGCLRFETKAVFLRLPQRNQTSQDLERTPQGR